MNRRLSALGTIIAAVALIAVTAGPAAAIDTLEDYLAEAESAEYSGRRIVMTSWDGDAEVGIYDVTHAGDRRPALIADVDAFENYSGAAVAPVRWIKGPQVEQTREPFGAPE